MPVKVQHMPRGTRMSAPATQQNMARFQQYVGSGRPDVATQAPFSLWLTFNPQSPLQEDPNSPGLMKTFVVPQARYAAATNNLPIATIQQLHLGWDTRLEQAGCLDQFNFPTPAGTLAQVDMDRYSMEISVWAQPVNRAPWSSTPGGPREQVATLFIPGAAAFGSLAPDNPLVLPCQFSILPNTAYTLQLRVPGLFDAGGPQLTAPSLSVGLVGFTPVVELLSGHYQRSAIQNAPSRYAAQTSSPLTLTTPVSGDVIRADGTDGVQTQLNAIEDRLLSDERLYQSAQPGVSTGVNADGVAEPVQSGYRTGWARHIIAINLFENWGSVRASTVGPELPFVVGPFSPVTGARAGIPIPDNFVLDHCLLACNWVSPPAPTLVPAFTGWGVRPTSPDFQVELGVVLGAHGPAQVEQQVAYASIVPAAPASNVVHSVFYTFPGGSVEAETLYEVPLVGPAAQPSWSAGGTGAPVYMGRTTTDAGARLPISPSFGAPTAPPVTDGREQHLWIKLLLQDAVNGLGDLGRQDDIRLGSAGHTVYLCGYAPTQGSSGKAGVGLYPATGEQGVHGGDKRG